MTTIVKLQHVSIPMPSGGMQAARAFYGESLGLEEKPVPSVFDSSRIAWFRLGDGDHELHVFTEDGHGGSPGQHLCIEVDDLDGWRQRLKSSGVAIEDETPIPGRPRFKIRDPFGNQIEVTQIEGEYN